MFRSASDARRPSGRRSRLRRLGLGAAITVSATLGFASAAAAATCQDQMERFARQYGLATTAPQAELRAGDPVTPPAPPMTQESRGITATDQLRDSSGVIQPPDVGAARVIPPPPTDDRMPTAPDVAPQTGPGQAAGSEEVLDAADRMKLEALVMGGLEAADRGHEQACLDRLEEARAIAEQDRR